MPPVRYGEPDAKRSLMGGIMKKKIIFSLVIALVLTPLLLVFPSSEGQAKKGGWKAIQKSIQRAKAPSRKPVPVPGSAAGEEAVAGPQDPELKVKGTVVKKSMIAFSAQPPGDDPVWKIFIMNPDGTGLKSLTTGPSADHYPTWSPDCKKLAFATAIPHKLSQEQAQEIGSDFYWTSQIDIVRYDGSDRKMLIDRAADNHNLTWSPVGDNLAFDEGSLFGRIYLSQGLGAPVQLTVPSDVQTSFPTWSPDGTKLAFVGFIPKTDEQALYTINVDGTGLKSHFSLDYKVLGLAWSPDGSTIAVSWLYPVPPKVVSSSKYDLSGDTVTFLAKVIDPAGDIKVISPEEYAKYLFGSQKGHCALPAWSPDGSQLACTGWYEDPWWKGIYVVNVDGSLATRLVKNAVAADWSPICLFSE